MLNPKAVEYAIIARKLFPRARIGFITNGTLIKKCSQEFFDICKANNICIDLTPYPIGIDYQELNDYIVSKGITGSRFQPGSDKKDWRKEPFDLNPDTPQSPATVNWLNCFAANQCIQLDKGKMGCVRPSNIKHLLKYFPDECKNIYISQHDFIDIYKAKDIEEIFAFFAKPHPFCRYCKVKDIQITSWEQSRRDISEWA